MSYKWERRESKRQARRSKIHQSGRSVFTIQAVQISRAHKSKKGKRQAA